MQRIAGDATGGGSGKRDGDVVRVAVGAGLVEGKDDMRAKLANESNGGRHERILGQALELAVAEVETADVLDAEGMAGVLEFGGTPVAEGAAGRQGGVADLAGLATGERDDHGFGAAGDVLGQGSADAEDFVVRVGKDSKQAERLGIVYTRDTARGWH